MNIFVLSTDPVEAYKTYYKKYKRHFASWTKRPEPDFMKE